MDPLEALVAIAQLRLRLQMIERNPKLLQQGLEMQIKRPIELAGLKGRLARAKATEVAIAETGRRYDAALDAIDEAHGAAKDHVGELEHYGRELKSTVEGMIATGANADPNEPGEKLSIDSGEVGDAGQIITSKPEGEG